MRKSKFNREQEAHLLSLIVEAICDKADALNAEANAREGMAYDAENSLPGCDDYDYADSYRHEAFCLRDDAYQLSRKAEELEDRIRELRNEQAAA